ncbi:MAG: Suppressor of Sensor Kinase (SLN1) [Bogoriella megaspora]|nr:MAG: Suppressor of Sensor Kinase (SLN1) [Bogoriella megaspora]
MIQAPCDEPFPETPQLEKHLAQLAEPNPDLVFIKSGRFYIVDAMPIPVADIDMHRSDSQGDSSASGPQSSSEDSDPGHVQGQQYHADTDGTAGNIRGSFSANHSDSPVDDIPPIVNQQDYRWANVSQRPREGSGVMNGAYEPSTQAQPNGLNGAWPPQPQRPSGPLRTPSNVYNPPRRATQYSINTTQRRRNHSANRGPRNPRQDYRAQERAYVERIRQDAPDLNGYSLEPGTPSLGHTTDSDSDEESPLTADYNEDAYDQETLLYYGNDDMQPTIEELKKPENRERLEWHSMLANVLTGDVVKQEKQRLTGQTGQDRDNSVQTEIWMGVRAKVCGRTLAAQRRMIEDGRSRAKSTIENIINFEIKGETEVGKAPLEQVADIVKKIEKCESLYPTRGAFQEAQARAATDAYRASCDAVIAWHNTTLLINTQLAVLQAWVGNDELDFAKVRDRSVSEGKLSDDSSFIDRILKEDGLKSLQGDNSLLVAVDKVIKKAKDTLIDNAAAFEERHLPAYLDELLTLINFPSRLIQEIIKMRLELAKNMKDPAQQGLMMAEQMIPQFQILLNLAVQIKKDYLIISQPEPGWDLPPCIDENFDSVVLDALKFYFKMLNWKLSGNKNTFKEAEIMEQEWHFSNDLARHLEGGDVDVAEQFCSLTSKSLLRLTIHFEKELQLKPEEVPGAEMDKRYKQILDSVRVRQRKLFRFSRILSQRYENCTEYNINTAQGLLSELYAALIYTGHVLVESASNEASLIYVIASPALENRPQDIQSLLSTCFHTDAGPDDPVNPYVLVLRPESPIFWDGKKIMNIGKRLAPLDIKVGRLRLVADGAQQRLANANLAFQQSTNLPLSILLEQRANLPRVNAELQRIKKTAYKLSNTIMDSVDLIRKQTVGLECQELIQSCFAFATEFGQRSVLYMDYNRRQLNNMRLTRLALDWVSFICDDCVASDRKTFRWAVIALEFAMMMTRGQNILGIGDREYNTLREKVAGCMSLLISHFDIMGARSTLAAQAEKQRLEQLATKFKQMDVSRLKDDEESSQLVREQWVEQLADIERRRKEREAERQHLGRVLEDSNEADRALTYLSGSATNVTIRWQQGQYVGGGSFGSVYACLNLDTGHLMAVKEIRLQDPQLIPTIVAQIRDEMGVLQVLDHPNIVSYHGIEPHRDKVYIFMEYCSGGSLAGLLEHGRIEDETVIMVYALQMLEGLAYLHEAGVVHRDIKPENILLDHNGVIKFVDFGAAKVIARQGRTLAHGNGGGGGGMDQREGRQRSMTGTPMYMSPEVIKGDTHSARHGAVDIWSLGCVILEMATGRRPWSSLDNEWAIMYNIAQGNPPQLPSRDQLSDDGIRFLKKCFERDPSRRASAPELLGDEWIMGLRRQMALEPGTPMTPSEGGWSANTAVGSSSGSWNGSLSQSRQNSVYGGC